MYASNPSLDRPLSMRSHVPFIIDCKRRTVDSSKEQSTIRKFEQRILTVDIRTMLTEKLRIKLRQYWRRDLHPLNITIDRSETGEGTQLEAGQNRPFLDSSSQIFVVFFAAWFNRFWDSFVLTRRRSKPLIGFQQSLFAVLLAFFSKMSNYTREYKGHKSEEVAIISCKTEGENVLKWADNSPSMCCTCTCTHGLPSLTHLWFLDFAQNKGTIFPLDQFQWTYRPIREIEQTKEIGGFSTFCFVFQTRVLLPLFDGRRIVAWLCVLQTNAAIELANNTMCVLTRDKSSTIDVYSNPESD